MLAICIGNFVDAGLYLLLLLSSSAQNVSWWVTAVILANLIPPIILAPVLGWLVDKTSGKIAWVVALGISALCVTGIGFINSPKLLVVLAAVQAVCAVVVSASVFKLLPKAESMDEKLASSFAVGIRSLASIAAPPLAAILATFSIRFAFWSCGIALLISTILVLRLSPSVGQVQVSSSSWHDIWLGTQSIRSMKIFRIFIPVILGIVVVTSMEGVAGVFYLQDVAGSPIGYAVLLSTWAVGSLLGAVITGRGSFSLSSVNSILLGGIAVSSAILVEGIFPVFLLIGIAFVIGGIGNAVHNVGIRNIVYEEIPSAQQAQVWSVVAATFSGAAAFGNFLGTPGFIAEAQPIIVVAGTAGVILVLATVGVQYAVRFAKPRQH